MKILLLSCDTGEGHNSACFAVAEALERNGADYEIENPLSFQGERTKKIVANTYNSIIKKTPKLFGTIYKVGDWYSSKNLPSPVYYANSIYAERLHTYITENHFDAVVCTHLFAMEALTALRKHRRLETPCYGVLTDYTCIPFFKETAMDGYFVPHQEMKDEMVSNGMAEEHIFPSGIPVGLQFSEHIPQAEARARLKIPNELPMYLIMTGGVGCGNIQELCEALLKVCADEDFNAYILAGHNRDMQDRLNADYGNSRQIRVIPFTREVAVYMHAADAMISKSGGLSSTEAAVANLPLVHLMAVPGCETKNADFFASHGMSVRADSPLEAAEAARELALNSGKAEKMKSQQRRLVPPTAADDIARRVMKL